MSKQVVVFMDECMFTSRSIVDKTWQKPAIMIQIAKKKLTFNAIGVVAAINLNGTVDVLMCKEGSIGLP